MGPFAAVVVAMLAFFAVSAGLRGMALADEAFPSPTAIAIQLAKYLSPGKIK